jgi:hypothetical protein
MLNNSIALIAVAALFGVEAIKVTKRIPRIVFTIITIIFVLWAIFVKQIADAWPTVGAFVTGIFEQPVSWFVLAIALFFVVRPFWQRGATRAAGAAPLPVQASAEVDLLRSHLNDLKAQIPAMIGDSDTIRTLTNELVATQQRIEKLEGSAAQNANGIEASMALTAEVQKLAINESKELREKLDEHKKQMDAAYSAQDEVRRSGLNTLTQKLEETWQRYVELDVRETANRKQTIEALHTIWLRKELADLEAVIRRDAGDCTDRLNGGEVYDDAKWNQWENVHHHWEQTLNEWLQRATFYGVDIVRRTMKVDDELYGRNWPIPDTQFPNAEAVRRFRKFRIIQEQWERIVPEIETGTHRVAYGGETQQEVRNGQRPG